MFSTCYPDLDAGEGEVDSTSFFHSGLELGSVQCNMSSGETGGFPFVLLALFRAFPP
jgi:hypothetical protein